MARLVIIGVETISEGAQQKFRRLQYASIGQCNSTIVLFCFSIDSIAINSDSSCKIKTEINRIEGIEREKKINNTKCFNEIRFCVEDARRENSEIEPLKCVESKKNRRKSRRMLYRSD
jgi:hypothetical protein